MIISKPLQKLNTSEKKEYAELISKQDETPLSQTLTWSHATLSQGLQVFVTYCANQFWGGISFLCENTLECVNGPVMEYNSSIETSRNIATYVHALCKAVRHDEYNQVLIRPRLYQSDAQKIMDAFSFPIHSYEKAATKIIPCVSQAEFLKSSSDKTRNSFKKTMSYNPSIFITEINSKNLTTFHTEYKKFAQNKKLFTPSEQWFCHLTLENPYLSIENASFFIAQAKTKHIITEFLIAKLHTRAYYLFAWEYREENAPNISTNLALQVATVDFLSKLNVHWYDLNGFIEDCPENHSYAGVNRFKKSLPGQILRYELPTMVFSY